MSVIEQDVAGVDVAVPPKIPSRASSASWGWDTKLPVSEKACQLNRSSQHPITN
jgi:hypothetical protein